MAEDAPLGINPSDLPEPDLNENAERVLGARYLICNEDGDPVEEPRNMFWRVAATIAQEEEKYESSFDTLELAFTFYRMMSQGTWMPNSPTLTGAGRDLGMLSACFVLPVEDTLENGQSGIYDTLMKAARIFQSGGGVGYDFSQLRPAGSMVKSTTGVASGPVTFMQIYDESVNVIKQGGHRRGAQMGILRVDHPDIMDFIGAKADTEKLTNFNISVAVTDEFMEAARRGEEYDLVAPHTQEVVGQLDASEVLDRIIEQAHATGEPGLFFIDEANRENPVPHVGDYNATNPCGEEPLMPYDSCNLGHINLAQFVVDGDIDWEGLRDTVNLEMRFLDNVIDANNYPLPEIRDLSDRIRRIGAGVMGWADMLIQLSIPYDSNEAREVASQVSEFLWKSRLAASKNLARERGVFPEWEDSVWGPDETCVRDDQGRRIRPETRLRHCKLSTVAPTGTTSIIAGCSGGIEPLYAVAFMRNQAGMKMPDVNDDFVEMAEEEGWHSEELMERVAEEGSVQEIDGVPAHAREIFKTAHDVAPSDHIRMQAVWQKNIDAAISKTINFPENADPEDVREGYMLAHELDCKGVTVYRDGSREGQALSVGDDDDEEPDPTHKRERPRRLRGITEKQKTPLGTAYVTVNEDEEGRPFELFVTLGKAGGSATADAEAIGRLVSLALRRGIPLEAIYEELIGISSDQVLGLGPNTVHSMPDGVAQVIGRILEENGGSVDGPEQVSIQTCPECDSSLSFTEGCARCEGCGYSECG